MTIFSHIVVTFGLGYIYIYIYINYRLVQKRGSAGCLRSRVYVVTGRDICVGCLPNVCTDFEMRRMLMNIKLSVDELYLVLL
jgi:hypothetical protein